MGASWGEHSGGNVGNLENLMGTHPGEKTKKKIPQSLTKPNRKTNLGLPNLHVEPSHWQLENYPRESKVV